MSATQSPQPVQNAETRPQNDNKATPTASPRRNGPAANTQERLFGSVVGSPRKIKMTDTFRSQIFAASDSKPTPRTPKKAVPVLERNPVTGEVKMPAKVGI
ncbi:hypothetical protein M3Y99_00415900 [Aphelenchoides fujianensis]|nr:hypothetical protein M3Y99_00415900 [Aphelenchoides fujianensis]